MHVWMRQAARGCSGKNAAEELEHFRNGVDPKFIGIPPFPQKKAERMGHGSLQQKQKCSKVVFCYKAVL
jgi:hypothetical protein